MQTERRNETRFGYAECSPSSLWLLNGKDMKLIHYQGIARLLNYRKIILLFLSICFSGTAIRAQNQRVDLSITNQPLLSAFKAIEKQTDLSISYNQTKLDVHKNITADYRNARLHDVMQGLLAGTGFSFIFEQDHLIIVPGAPQKTGRSGQAATLRYRTR